MPGNDERVAGGFASENKPFAVYDVRSPPLVQPRKCVLPGGLWNSTHGTDLLGRVPVLR